MYYFIEFPRYEEACSRPREIYKGRGFAFPFVFRLSGPFTPPFITREKVETRLDSLDDKRDVAAANFLIPFLAGRSQRAKVMARVKGPFVLVRGSTCSRLITPPPLPSPPLPLRGTLGVHQRAVISIRRGYPSGRFCTILSNDPFLPPPRFI